MLDDDPLWYDRVEAGEPEGPILLGIAFVFVTLGRVWGLPNTLWMLAARMMSTRG